MLKQKVVGGDFVKHKKTYVNVELKPKPKIPPSTDSIGS